MDFVEEAYNRYHGLLSQHGRRCRDEIQSEVSRCISSFADVHPDDEDTHDENIRKIFETFDSRVDPPCVADALGCSESYVRRFGYDSETGCAYEKEWPKKTQAEKVSPGQRTLSSDGTPVSVDDVKRVTHLRCITLSQ